MKKIIILAIALLSTGIVVSAMTHKSDANLKPVVFKITKTTADKSITNDAIATAD